MALPLGTRGYWAYTSDTGKVYARNGRDEDNAAVGNTACGRDDHPAMPRKLKPRVVWATVSPGVRRAFVIGDVGNSKYTSGGTITADGLSWTITGRRGERDQGAVSE